MYHKGLCIIKVYATWSCMRGDGVVIIAGILPTGALAESSCAMGGAANVRQTGPTRRLGSLFEYLRFRSTREMRDDLLREAPASLAQY